jgi:hypothetical protein
MANIFGIDVESPQEAQERILREQLGRMKAMGPQSSAGRFGQQLGRVMSEMFGGDRKSLDQARDRAKALSGAERTGRVKAADEAIVREGQQRNQTIQSQMEQNAQRQLQQMAAGGAHPDEIAAEAQAYPARIQQALAASTQSTEQQRAKLLQDDSADFIRETIDFNVANKGMSEITAKQYARAEAAVRLDKLPGEQNKILAQQLRDANTIEMRQDKVRQAEMAKLKAQTDSAEAATAVSNRSLLETLSIEELEVKREMALEAGEDASPFDGLIKEKREEQRLARETLEMKREDLRLRQKKEERIANQLNTTEFGYLKTQNEVYDASRDMQRSAERAKTQLDRAERAGRSAGKPLDVQEQMKEYAGMQDADISVAQKALSERAMQRAFSLKQAGAMSDAEFEAYMTAVPPANASYEQWNEFLRLDAIVGKKAAARAAFHADYLGGTSMSEAYPGISDSNYPRGMEGLNQAWRQYEDQIYADIEEQYSRENWGAANNVSTLPAQGGMSDDDLINEYGKGRGSTTAGVSDINVAP